MITALPSTIRDAAATEAEKVVEFDEGDFYREVDAITPMLAGYYIELGAQKAAAAMGLHFCDENSESFVPGVTTEDIRAFEKSVVAGVLNEAGYESFFEFAATLAATKGRESEHEGIRER